MAALIPGRYDTDTELNAYIVMEKLGAGLLESASRHLVPDDGTFGARRCTTNRRFDTHMA
jgi:hypothetical protein